MKVVKEYIAVVTGEIFPNINRLPDKAYYFFIAEFSHDSRRESSLDGNEEAKMKSGNDKAVKIDRNGNKINC